VIREKGLGALKRTAAITYTPYLAPKFLLAGPKLERKKMLEKTSI
jgi:hypothetical protein